MPILEMKQVSKFFGKIKANLDVNLSVEEGEVHALLGENGAGKSTLMNILYGLYDQTSGEIYFKGELLKLKNSKDAINKGIGMIHQHFMLVPTLTVIENVVLGMPNNKTVLDLKNSAMEFAAMAEKYNMPIDPWAKVSSLSVGQQQRAEILKALYRKATLLILDEPTAVLTPQEVGALFQVIRRLKKENITIILISHKMNEIMEICDRCSILRKGEMIETIPISQIEDTNQLAQLMVGREVNFEMDKQDREVGDTVLSLKEVTYYDKDKVKRLNQVSFDIKQGEILGICGVDGNGQSELARCITGLLHPSEGKIELGKEDITKASTNTILKKGVSHIPEDRHHMGMLMDMTINENLILMSVDKEPYSRKQFINWKWIRSHNEELIEKYDVKTPGIDERAGNLSGGNQQKFVVGRELDRNPNLLVAMHPDRGLDIGATKFIQQCLLDERNKGAAVLLISTELDEIMELSDRIVVINSGNIVGIVNQKEATREMLGLMMASKG